MVQGRKDASSIGNFKLLSITGGVGVDGNRKMEIYGVLFSKIGWAEIFT
jgi:hypothetical protein